MPSAPTTLAECGANFLGWLESLEEEPQTVPPTTQESPAPPSSEPPELETMISGKGDVHVLFIDFEPAQMKELWLDTHHHRSGNFSAMFVNICDPQLRMLVEFEPFIIVVCNDHSEAEDVLPPFLSSVPRPHVVVVPCYDQFPNDLTVWDDFYSCSRTSDGLEDAVFEIIPF